MLLIILEAVCAFLFGYLIGAVFTHENDEISATFFIPALIAELFVIFPIAIIRAGGWLEAGLYGEEWKIIEDNWHWAFVGFCVFWVEQYLSTFLELNDE